MLNQASFPVGCFGDPAVPPAWPCRPTFVRFLSSSPGCALPARCPAEPGSFRPEGRITRAACWLLGYCCGRPGRRLKQRRQRPRQQWQEEQAAAAAQDGDVEEQKAAAPAAAAGTGGVNVKAQQGPPPRRHKSLLGLPILSPGTPRLCLPARLLCCCRCCSLLAFQMHCLLVKAATSVRELLSACLLACLPVCLPLCHAESRAVRVWDTVVSTLDMTYTGEGGAVLRCCLPVRLPACLLACRFISKPQLPPPAVPQPTWCPSAWPLTP